MPCWCAEPMYYKHGLFAVCAPSGSDLNEYFTIYQGSAMTVSMEEAGLSGWVGTTEVDIDGKILELSDCLLRVPEPMKKTFTVGKSRQASINSHGLTECSVARKNLKSLYRSYLRRPIYSPALKEIDIKK